MKQKLSLWNWTRQTNRMKKPQKKAQESGIHSFTDSGIPQTTNLEAII